MSHGWRFVLVLVALASLVHKAGQMTRADDQLEQSVLPATAIAPASPPDAAPPEKYKLAFKFRLNQIVHQEITSESEMTTQKNQDTETARNSSKSKRHYRVAAVDEKTGIADLELTIDWVHMLASIGEGDGKNTEPVEFQSDDPKKHPKKFNDVLASIGKHAWLRFSPTGAPVKAPPGAPQPKGNAAPIVTDGSLEAFLFPLPEQPVAVGEIWRERFDVHARDVDKNRVRISLQRTYKLTEVKNGRAVIELRTAVLTPVKAPEIAAQLIQREINGKIVFDIEQGWIVSREWSIDNTIVNPVGANSSMRARSRYREKLLGSEATADRESKIRPQNQPVATK